VACWFCLMSRYDFRSPRLYVEASLGPGARVPLADTQAHYLTTVMRLKSGDRVLVFNGIDGEWSAVLEMARRTAALTLDAKTREQAVTGDLHYLFAPLKTARLDYMVQKAVEMGVSRLQPVLMQHGQVARVNIERVRANAIEAAEQCGILALPDIGKPVTLTEHLAERDPGRCLVFCDEDAATSSPITALGGHARAPVAVLVGPEGGFSENERKLLLEQSNVIRLSLGPRILRADTAAVAALALVQVLMGDWV
jgi:16S rRNA (uracil1498-N3)-methyltransferase